MKLCDELEAETESSMEAHQQLVTCLLGSLTNSASNEELTANWNRLSEHFDMLFTSPESIDQMKQTILQLAVMGKLVPQNPKDPSARELLKEIEIEKERLISEGKIKRSKPLQKIKPEETPYALPEGWEYFQLGGVILSIDAGWSPKCEVFPAREHEWGVLKTTAVQPLLFLPHENKALPSKLTPRPDVQVQKNDILITRAGPKNRVGICCVANPIIPRLMLSDKIIRFHVINENIYPDFCALCLNTGHGAEQIDKMKSGMADSQMNISQDKLRAVILPLPPLAEQHRIVAKVDELMAICDQLSDRLREAEVTQAQLASTITQNALKGESA